GYYQMVLRSELANLKRISQENGKIMVLSETGMEGIPYGEWWTGVLLPVLREYPVAYVLTWRNAHDRAEHFYAPFPGSGDSEDFIAFHDDPATVFLQEKK
ncbi:MAG: beta-mannosidase, partial [Bacteroidales bacterium]|nr:beta-mannosidase [Bacteroidales bacterium]